MKNFSDFGLQRILLAKLAQVSPPTIKKYVDKMGISTISADNGRYSAENCHKVMRDAFASKYPIDKKVHVFYNFKGGVGKTTFSFQASALLALMGYKVLVIDTDPQANLTTAFGVYFKDEKYFDESLKQENTRRVPIAEEELLKIKTLYDVVAKNYPIKSAIIPVFEGLSLIPSNLSLTRLEQELFTTTRREEQLKDLIDPLKNDYDFIIFDSNPNISNTNLNAVNAADIVHVVCELQAFSLSSTNLLLSELKDFFENKMKKEMPKINIIPNKYTSKDSSCLSAAAALKSIYRDFIRPEFHVRLSSDFNRSSAEGIPIPFTARKNSIAMEDLLEVVDEIIVLSSSSKHRYNHVVSEAA